jgi:tetratricopeptide (TPR) repeat protein
MSRPVSTNTDTVPPSGSAGADDGQNRRTLWILNPVRDLSLFVATPLLIFPLAWAIRASASDQFFALVVAAFGQVGHNLPGFIRAYGDRDLFRRYRFRFIVAPAMLGAACLFAAFYNIHALILASVAWAIWHALMQTYGFIRIYAAKAGENSAFDRRLDFSVCLMWFSGAILLNENPLRLMLSRWYRCGGFLIPASWVDTLQGLWWGLLAIVTGLWIVRAGFGWLKGTSPSPVKLLVTISSIGFYWYAYAVAGNILVGAAMFEVFHDVQYLAIVWLFNRRRVEQSANAGAFFKFIFGRSGALIGIYVGLCFAFGSFRFLEHGLSDGPVRNVLLAFLATSGLLHYYYDGFIWKIRETNTSQGLGLSNAKGTLLDVPALLHASKWAIGLTPVVLLTLLEINSPPNVAQRSVNLSLSLPNSHAAQAEAGEVLAAHDRLSESVTRFQRALELQPSDDVTRIQLAEVLHRRGRVNNALQECALIMQVQPDHVEARLLASRLLAESGNPSAAETQLRAVLAREPDRVDARTNLGIILATVGRLDESVTEFSRSLKLRSDPDTHFNLARVLAQQGSLDEARRHYQQALQLRPDFTAADEALSRLLSENQNTDTL